MWFGSFRPLNDKAKTSKSLFALTSRLNSAALNSTLTSVFSRLRLCRGVHRAPHPWHRHSCDVGSVAFS